MAKRKWTDEQLMIAVLGGNSWSDVARSLGLSVRSGETKKNLKPHVERLKLSTEHFGTSRIRDETGKVCAYCKVKKPYEDFFRATNSVDGRAGYCKLCKREHVRIGEWRRKYGLTPQDYEALLEQQNGLCAICERLPTGGRGDMLEVDHDHNTQEVRGLLCGLCNRALGGFQDDPERVDRAAAYLRSWRW